MNIFSALIIGIVEGLTEFVPLSSTFHILLTQQILGFVQTDFFEVFAVIIQGAAILPVAWLALEEWRKNPKIAMPVIASFIPTALVGFAGYQLIKETFFDSTLASIFVFTAIGFLFYLFEWLVSNEKIKLNKEMKEVPLSQAVLIGLAQALAVFPGVSRAGSVFLTMMLLGYKRDQAAKYSFLLGLPTILLAALYDLYKARDFLSFEDPSFAILLALGSASAFITSYFVVQWLIGYLKNRTLKIFGFYRIMVGGALLLWYFLMNR